MRMGGGIVRRRYAEHEKRRLCGSKEVARMYVLRPWLRVD